MSIATGGNQVTLPHRWPLVESTTQTIFRNTEYSYFQNVVESSYSFAFYGWNEWEHLIDWQALSGINLALAYTGQEEVYRKTFNAFGVNNSQFGNWSNGPAWLAWSRGQSMHGVGSGGADGHSDNASVALTLSWMQAQADLQRKILARMRAIGIVAILPAFQGNVPPVLKTLYPSANISRQGTGRHYAAWLDATDPLFGRIADKYMTTLIGDYGTDHWYEADGYFTAGRPPWLADPRTHMHDGLKGHRMYADGPAPVDPAVVASAKRHAEEAYMGMNRTDPNAVMMYQGWILFGEFSHIQGIVDAVPRGHLVIGDMWCEFSPIWSTNDQFSFYDTPFIWGVLHNFGGNVGMWGSVPTLNTGPFAAFANASSLAGLGLFPEGIDQNPPYYQFLLDVNWAAEEHPLDMHAWWTRFATERYGRADARAVEAWHLLAETVYGAVQQVDHGTGNRGMYQERARDGLTSYPHGGTAVAVQPDWYNVSKVVQAWRLLQDVAESCVRERTPMPRTLAYDLANTAREALAKKSNPLLTALETATTVAGVVAAGASLQRLVDDVDALLCATPPLSVVDWIRMARRLGNTSGAQDQYEWAARVQPTTWLPACPAGAWPTGNTTTSTCGARSDLADYANKQWGGLLGGFYGRRQQCYVNTVTTHGLPVDGGTPAYNTCIDRVAWEFQHSVGTPATDLCVGHGRAREDPRTAAGTGHDDAGVGSSAAASDPTDSLLVISQRLLKKYC